MRRSIGIVVVMILVALASQATTQTRAVDQYRFGVPKDTAQTYSDGTVVPHRFQAIERMRPDGTWEAVGYIEIHLHRVKKEADDLIDISVGTTVRINQRREKVN